MASRHVSKVFDYIQYGISIGLAGGFAFSLSFMYLIHKERMDVATQYEDKIMAYRDQMRTVSDAAGLADDGSDRVLQGGVSIDSDASGRVRAASAAQAAMNGRPLAHSMLETQGAWAAIWSSG